MTRLQRRQDNEVSRDPLKTGTAGPRAEKKTDDKRCTMNGCCSKGTAVPALRAHACRKFSEDLGGIFSPCKLILARLDKNTESRIQAKPKYTEILGFR